METANCGFCEKPIYRLDQTRWIHEEGYDISFRCRITATPSTDWWIPAAGPKPCWVCGEPTRWAYLDMGYQHLDCDAYPSEEGDVKIVRGVRQ